LIEGETGTRKELIARRIHELSSRSKGCLVAVNCPAVSESLFETEFFGHVKGAYTGATDARQGKFKLADGGTLLLDEIGELALTMQPKLLRVLQEGEVQPVGGESTVKVDVRFIAATNVDLRRAIGEGKFRQDLFFRLNTMTIRVPPLRERLEDIPLLVEYFIKKYGGTGVTSIAHEAMQRIQACSWPGNIRELENVIRCGVALAKAAQQDIIHLQHLPAELAARKWAAAAADRTLPHIADSAAREARRSAARRMMHETGGDAKEAAVRLGISKRYLYHLLGNA
jgi:transcriptional regulator with GAF, ATPase, and Fis domain